QNVLYTLGMGRTPSKVGIVAALVAAVAVLACARNAAAADEPAPAAAETSWYGWQTLLSDAGVIGLWSLAAAVDDAKYGSGGARQSYEVGSTALVALGFATYGLGAPAIHLAHGREGTALRSLALRLGLPVAGALVGVMIGSGTCDPESEVPCPVVAGVVGGALGGVAAAIVDGAVLAREPVAK